MITKHTLQSNYSKYLHIQILIKQNRIHLEFIKCYLLLTSVINNFIYSIYLFQTLNHIKQHNEIFLVGRVVVPWNNILLYFRQLYYLKIWCHYLKGIQLCHCILLSIDRLTIIIINELISQINLLQFYK